MTKGCSTSLCSPDGNGSERISFLSSAGLGNLLQQPQLTFLTPPMLQGIMMCVFYILVAGIIVPLQAH